MSSTHEEGNTLIVQQVANVSAQTSLAVADDTDVYVLLLHFCYRGDISGHNMMISPVQGRALIDLNATGESIKTSCQTYWQSMDSLDVTL